MILMCAAAKWFQLYPSFCDPMDCACQAFLSMGFSKQEYWSWLPCPPPGGFPDPEIETASLTSPTLGGRYFITSTIWKAQYSCIYMTNHICLTKDCFLQPSTLGFPPCFSLGSSDGKKCRRPGFDPWEDPLE